MEFTITYGEIMGALALVASFYGFYKMYKEIKKPSDDLKSKVNKHEELLNNDNDRLKEVEESNKMILQSLLVIINHDITGNGIEQLKETRNSLQEYLINK